MTKQKINGEELVELTKAALEDVKAQDIQVIDVRDKHSLTDYMIIATGTSNRQINAMLDEAFQVRGELIKERRVVAVEHTTVKIGYALAAITLLADEDLV